jgi:hypothetical protein
MESLTPGRLGGLPSTSSTWRRRLATVVLGALTLAVLATAPATAAPNPIGSSELHWGIKSGFRSYITGIAAGTITASDGAAKEGSGAAAPYLWAGDGGTYDAEANAGTIKFNGTVKFSAPAHTIWHITISDPVVVLDGDSSATLLADVSYATGGTEASPEDQGSASDVAFADLTVGAPTGTGTYTFSNVAAALTEAGSEAFGGFYAAGTALDPLTFTISADPPPTVNVSDATVVEGDSGTKNASFTVSLSQARTVAVSVKYATANGTAVAPADYTAKAPTALSFSAGQTSKTITVPVKGDLAGEADETFSVVLSGATNIAIGDGTGTGTITDNDPPVPHVSVGDISLTEGNSAKNAVFTVSLTNAAKAAVSVKYATANGTAVAPSDYTAKALTTLSFSAGQTSKTVSVALKADAFGEGDETFSLNLSAPVGVVFDDGQATATIVNDDAPAPEVSVADVSITEGSSALSSKNLIFTVQLSAPAQGAVSLKYKTANGTAVAPSDFAAKALTALSFSKGQTSKTVSIPIKGDTVDEADESFQLQLSDASAGLTIVDGLATGTIVDDD